jgi:hypothetical protein
VRAVNMRVCVGALHSLFMVDAGGESKKLIGVARSAFLCSLIVGRQQWGHPACKVKIKRGPPLFDV